MTLELLIAWISALTSWTALLTWCLARAEARADVLWSLVVESHLRELYAKRVLDVRSEVRLRDEAKAMIPERIRAAIDLVARRHGRRIARHKSFQEALPHLLRLAMRHVDLIDVMELSDALGISAGAARILIAAYLWERARSTLKS